MQQTKILLKTIKKILKNKNLTYKDLSEKMNLSESSIKRLFSKNALSLERLEEICDIIDIDFYELIIIAHKDSQNSAKMLSLEQERILAQNYKLLIFLYFIVHGWSLSYIIEEYDISESEAIKMLLELDKLGIIELHSENRFRLLISKNILWHQKGPIWNEYLEMVTNDFIDHNFDQSDERLIFNTGQFSSESLAIIERKLDAFIDAFNELASKDALLPIKNRFSTGLFIAFRPWVFSLISGLRRKKRDKSLRNQE